MTKEEEEREGEGGREDEEQSREYLRTGDLGFIYNEVRPLPPSLPPSLPIVSASSSPSF